MADTNETCAEVIAKMRRIKYNGEECTVKWCLTEWADRFDAAYKREKAEWVNANAGLAKLVDIEKIGDCAKLREAISTLRTALKEIRNDVLDMVMNHKSEDPDSYAHGLCLSIGGACDMALHETKEFANEDE